jgi:hypothetical protein
MSFVNNQEQKPVPPVELSLKYIAWNIKEMSESQKTMALAIKMLAEAMIKQKNQPTSMPRQDDFPF